MPANSHQVQSMLRETTRAESFTVQASVIMLNVKDHDSKIRKTITSMACEEKEYISMGYVLKWHLNTRLLQRDETKVKMFGCNVQHQIWRKLNTS